jgi:hypothetical protein
MAVKWDPPFDEINAQLLRKDLSKSAEASPKVSCPVMTSWKIDARTKN